ncbi:MAG TPA: RnfABCDGE type electron transport complex subunit C [Phycisphaerae bacterium]|nr:RnfABCDGE type electron transport complex subunit C [Phycisphaerae bacterium]
MALLTEILGPRQSFDGGLFLPDYKAGIAKRPAETLAVQETLRVPLTVRRDLPTQVVVKHGDPVRRGQFLSIPAAAASLPAHAPTSGTVTALDRVWTPMEGFLPCAVLQPDGRDEWIETSRRWESDSFAREIRDAGVFSPLPREGLHELLLRASRSGVSDLIINAMETEPFLVSDLRTLVEESGRIVDAIAEIADSIGVQHVHFALPYRHRRVVKRIEAETQGRYINVVPLAHKYPQCSPLILLKTLIDREVVPGGSPIDAGALILPLAAVRMAAQAILDGRPVTHALVTVAGDAVERPGVYRVAVGTPLLDLARRVGLLGEPRQIIWGGPLSGLSLDRQDAVITREACGVLMFQDAAAADPVPCIRCGWCAEDCPAGLDPSLLLHLEAQDECSTRENMMLKACVDCGLCSHICPSQLPLAQSIWRARYRFNDIQFLEQTGPSMRRSDAGTPHGQ